MLRTRELFKFGFQVSMAASAVGWKNGLSDAALQWMMDSIRNLGLGLELDPSAIPTGVNPNYEIDFKNDPGFFKLAGIKLREVGDGIDDLHESVIKRWHSRNDYRPKNLEIILSKLNSSSQD